MTRRLLAATLGVLGIISVGYPAQQNPPYLGARKTSAGIHIEPVRGNIYMLAGAGGNITLQVGPEGILVVDTGPAEKTEAVLAAIQEAAQFHLRALSGPSVPIRYIINTSINAEHIGGNWNVAKSPFFAPVGGGEQIIAHGNVLNRLTMESEDKTEQPGTITDAYFTDWYKINRFFNGEGIQVLHTPSGHTDGDSIVWFRGSDVISAGDILETNRYPAIDIQRGGTVKGVINGLNAILDLSYPEFRGQGGTIIIPGHGRLCFANDVAYFRDMVTIVRDRIQHLVDKKNTLQQIKASKLTVDYDPIYGKEPGSADRFIEAVYQSLIQKSSN